MTEEWSVRCPVCANEQEGSRVETAQRLKRMESSIVREAARILDRDGQRNGVRVVGRNLRDLIARGWL